jgi:hypothetical protein
MQEKQQRKNGSCKRFLAVRVHPFSANEQGWKAMSSLILEEGEDMRVSLEAGIKSDQCL